MSGVNWLPGWTLDRSTSHGRFRTITLDKPQEYGIGDFYADPQLLRAQVFFARRVGERLRDHPALYAWDIGNEFSNVREPSAPRDAADWSTRLTEALIESSGVGATGGLHGEDLEEDRNIRPSSIAARWKMATIHGYSCYCSFSTDRQDANVVPFLMELAQSFSGKPVLVSELGNPQCPPGRDSIGSVACLSEDEMVRYAYGVIDRLQRRGALGAMWWCWADYDRALAMLPPFDLAPHELTFGIVRSDGSFKPVAETLARFAREGRAIEETPAPPIAAERDHYAGLPQSVGSEYRAYREAYA
jgi:endo-1,4-beta-mannosidase